MSLLLSCLWATICALLIALLVDHIQSRRARKIRAGIVELHRDLKALREIVKKDKHQL